MKLFGKIKMEATFWLARRLPACTEVLPLISQSLERKWTARERFVMRLHFLYCDHCERYLKQLRFMREAARLGADKIYETTTPSTPALSTQARERFKRALRSNSE